jgi:hypothetical protein
MASASWQGILEGTNRGIVVAELDINDNSVQGKATVTEISGDAYSLTIKGTRAGLNIDLMLGGPTQNGLTTSGTVKGQLSRALDEITGTWSTNLQTFGTVHLFLIPPVQLSTASKSPPQSAVSKTILLPTCRLDVSGLVGLIQVVVSGTRVLMPTFNIVHAGRALIKIGVQALVDDKALPPIIHEMAINANESWEGRGYTVVSVNLKRHESNSVFVSGLDGAWVAGKCDEIKSYIANYETPFATWYRNRGAWLNSIVFLVMLSALPSVSGFWNRLAFAGIVTAMLFLLLWSHQRAVPSCTIILKSQPPSFWDRYRDPIVGFLLTIVGTAISGFLAYVFASDDLWLKLRQFFGF